MKRDSMDKSIHEMQKVMRDCESLSNIDAKKYMVRRAVKLNADCFLGIDHHEVSVKIPGVSAENPRPFVVMRLSDGLYLDMQEDTALRITDLDDASRCCVLPWRSIFAVAIQDDQMVMWPNKMEDNTIEMFLQDIRMALR